MEKISAACAMEWSIELEKALRSKSPTRIFEAIDAIGSRLQHWSEEPEPTIAVYNMFGLVPAEDQLFANTIMLRLADAFKFGDKRIRLGIVRIFMSIFKQGRRKKKSRRAKGFLSKDRVHNYLELLSRVSCVYENGDIESRAMSLALFGCWADFAKDNSRIRYLILTSMVSSHDVEVRASIFGAACFCEVADDFAAVILEMLPDIITSSGVTMPIRLAAVRVLGRLGCTHSIANKAFKIGQKLLMDSSEEDVVVAALVSLTKLASRSMFLAFEQTGLILSYLHQDRNSHIQAVALRCLHFLLESGMSYVLISSNAVEALFTFLGRENISPHLQHKALENLRKILQHQVYCADASEFARLVDIIENLSHAPLMSSNFEAIRFLVYTSGRMAKREKEAAGFSSLSLRRHVFTLITDRITFLVSSSSGCYQFESGAVSEVQRLLNLLLNLVKETPDLGCMVIDKLHLFIEAVANMEDGLMDSEQASFLAYKKMHCKSKKVKAIRSKLVCHVLKLLMVSLENLDAVGAITFQLYEKVKHEVLHVQHCSFNCFTQIMYSLILHSPIFWGTLVNETTGSCKLDDNSGCSFLSHLRDSEITSLECAKKLLTERDHWHAYQAGMHAACHSSWVTASFIFEQLRTKVQSDPCRRWLESLTYFAQAERNIQLLRSPNGHSKLTSWIASSGFPDELGPDISAKDKEIDYSEILHGAICSLRSSREKLERHDRKSSEFFFQRWFLVLRSKILETVLDMLKLLAVCIQDIGKNEHLRKGILISSNSIQQITRLSPRLKSLALEMDLLASSFIGMDCTSLKTMVALALSCAVLAFTTGFAFPLAKLSEHTTIGSCSLKNGLHTSLLQDLICRLGHLSPELRNKLCQLGEIIGYPKQCIHMLSRHQVVDAAGEVKDILGACSTAVSSIVSLQSEVNRTKNEEILSQVTKAGLHILTEIVLKWIFIPFRVPKTFFNIRPCVGSELFASSADPKVNVMPVLQGCHLSLNLCLQLRNVLQQLPFGVKKLYCLLCCEPSFKISDHDEDRDQNAGHWSPWQNDEMVEMSTKLFQRVTESSGNKMGNWSRNNDEAVQAFVYFEPNNRGQGFSSCLLDVSRFPAGFYQIKWQSSLIDMQGSYWNLLPLNPGPVFCVCESRGG